MLCEEPRPAYDRVHLSDSSPARRPRTCRWCRPASSSASIALHLNDAARPSTARRDSGALGALPARCCLRQAGARHRLVSVRAAGAGHATAATASSTAPSKTWKRMPRMRRALEDRRGDRRRPAGPGSAKALRDLGLETHVVEFAPRLMAVQVDDAGGRVLRRKIEALGVARAHSARTPTEIVDGEAGTPPPGVRRRQPPRNRHDRVLRRHPPARRAGARSRARRRRARRHRHRRPAAAPPIPTSTPSANARSGTAASSAWSRPATRWRDVAARHLRGETRCSSPAPT